MNHWEGTYCSNKDFVRVFGTLVSLSEMFNDKVSLPTTLRTFIFCQNLEKFSKKTFWYDLVCYVQGTTEITSTHWEASPILPLLPLLDEPFALLVRDYGLLSWTMKKISTNAHLAQEEEMNEECAVPLPNCSSPSLAHSIESWRAANLKFS